MLEEKRWVEMSRGYGRGSVDALFLRGHWSVTLRLTYNKEARILTVSGILLFKLHMIKFVSLEYV